jgi:flagellar hook-associated protein 3 FlgL
MTRVTQASIASSTLANLQQSLGRISRTQEQMSSGRVLNRPSDSPTGTVSALQLRGQVAATEQHAANARSGLDLLGAADSALSDSVSALGRVRELAVLGANATQNATSREALAQEVEQLREHMLTLANTTHGNRAVFAGTAGGARAFDDTGAYVGDTGTVQRRISDTSTVRADTSASQAFGPGGQVFSMLTDLAADLRAGGPAVSARLTDVDAARERMLTALTDVGARYSRLSAAEQTASSRLLDLRASLADVEGVDLAKAVVDLQVQEVAYQAALGASARVIQPSLMDYLR